MINMKHTIQNYIGINIPDSCDFDNTTQRLVILPEAVVSRQSDGKIVSRFHDDVWNFEPYKGKKIYFKKFGNDTEIVKSLCYAELLYGGRGNGINVSGTQDVSIELYRIYKAANEQGISIKNFLEDNNQLQILAEKTNNSQAAGFQATLLKLIEHGTDVGINVKADPEREKLLSAKRIITEMNTKQTPIIPPQIYFDSYAQRWQHFEQIEKHIKSLTLFITKFANDPYFGRSGTDKRRTIKSKLVPFEIAAKECNIWEFMVKHEITKAIQIEGFISKIMGTCANLVGQSTGMRGDELKMLQQGCFKKGNLDRPPVIIGWEKKGNNGVPREQEWVTHSDISRVITVVETLGNAMLEGVSLIKSENIPLFILSSTVNDYYFREAEIVYSSELVTSNHLTTKELGLCKDELIITTEMMTFLEKTHRPGRFKSDKNIAVGKPWHFASHQYRRSYAFYALNSGMVSLTSISKQLAHGLLSTTASYANGATNVAPIICDGQSHIAREIEKQRHENDALALVYNVITNRSRIPAPMQEWASKINADYDANPDDPATHIWESREKAIKEMRKGHIHYKSTPIGGCITSEPCDAFLTFNFKECGECDQAFPIESKIDGSLKTAELTLLDLLKLGYTEESKEVKTHRNEIEYFKKQKAKFTKDHS